MVHLYRNGFKPRYFVWSDHGESDGLDGIFYNSMHVDVYNMVAPHGHIGVEQVRVEHDRVEHDRVREMINDAFGVQGGMEPEQYFDKAPNEEARHFYDQLEESSCPLCEGSPHSALSVAVRLMKIKSDWNVPNAAMDSMVDLLGELVNPEFNIPKNFYQAKRLVSKLGLTYDRIYCCVNGCMLFYKIDSELENCKFSGHTRYKRTPAGKMVPVQAMHYLPLIPRLKRLYASMKSAPHMRWHREYRRSPGVLSHPSDGEAWKHFDNVYPDFASEPRNVRLGLCLDGFTPFSNNASPYSCWPVFLTLYNLPPEMCMTSPYIFLSCVIPGPLNPKSLIDVYLQPLIDELKQLWFEGVLTYDISNKQNFIMRASLMWTINDFLAYGMLSGWMIAGKLACPYCMENSKAFTLKHGRKNTWFDCHRQFLPMDHEFRKMKNAFRKNKVESDPPPPLLTGHHIWERISQLPKVTEDSPSRLPGYGAEHNWTKQSIFWELPYWKDNLLRHNLDVMHIEKNYFDNLFNTVMDVKGKTKDNPKARMDIKEYCRRKELWLQELQNGKIVKPKASFSFTLDEKREIIEWVKNLRMPEGYASNLGKRADMNEGKLIDLGSGKLLESSLDRMEENILVTTTKLEKIFPCGFFYVMEHLLIHLVQEARLGGPVQTRWMYPFERRNMPNHNDEGDIDPLFPPISIFNQNGRGSKKRRKRGFTDMEMQSVVTHILLNCPEIQSYVNLFVNIWGNEAIYTEFSKWLRSYVYDEYSSVQHLQLVKEVALGPQSEVLAMNKYCVNGFKFQTEKVSRNKKTNNSGVYIQGDVDGTGQTIKYYGVIQEIIEVRDKADWWVVIKSKHVERIEIDNVLDVAYQNDVAIVQQQVDVELETTLQHPQHILEEVSDDEILNVEEEISENEENESFDDEEWDDNENETTEEEEWENDGIETSEEE
ncbi:hypothetical protein MTR67_017717 [Solanum verrucosum]|uniref:DUF4218 domain-containing protein n=1 Tax=Solanum verrucosum TaxID=315347 RepID=A0AAF0QKE2_SOLVR|nr:hypothetical protein MTR67_017717 [Solanum verrucosum]